MDVLRLDMPELYAYWIAPFIPPEKINTEKESVFYHKSPIATHEYSERHEFANDFNALVDYYMVEYTPETAHFLVNFILKPDCCAHLPNRVRLSEDHEEELKRFLQGLPHARKVRLMDQFASLELKENQRLKDNKTMGHYLRDVLDFCPFCTMDSSNKHYCMFCKDQMWTFLEIMHKPQYWRRVSENVYISMDILTNRLTRGIEKTNFYVNLNKNRKNVGVVDEFMKRGFNYFGSLCADLFEQCPTHINFAIPTLEQICVNRITIMCGMRWFKHNRSEARLMYVRDRTDSVKDLIVRIRREYEIYAAKTDLFEPLA